MINKIFKTFILVFFITLTCACKSGDEIAQEKLNEYVKKECNNYSSIVSYPFGGGEEETYGIVETGYCDNNLIRVISESQGGTLSRKFTVTADNFPIIEDKNCLAIFGNNLFGATIYTNNNIKDLTIDLVVSKNNLNQLIDIIKNNFIFQIGNTINYDEISINIYTTYTENLNTEDVKVAYLINDFHKALEFSNSKYDILEETSFLGTYGYQENNITMQEQLINSLNEYIQKENL